jgi:myo-inositol-1(or 4)-monophosphatase
MHGRRLATTEAVVALATPDSEAALDRLTSWAATEGIDLTVRDVGETVTDDDYDSASETLGVTVGGDGAFLEGVRAFAPREIPLLGINTGTLAFLARVRPSETATALDEVVRGRGRIHARQQYHVEGPGLDATGINEVTVEKSPPERRHGAKVGRLHAFVDDEYLGEYFGTGLIVNTPTGSTGRALSNGGPIHYPHDNFTLQIVPYETHNIGGRPVVVSREATVRVVPEDEFRVVIDGGREAVTVDAGETLSITGADQPAYVVRTPHDEPFVPALASKLGWGLRGVDDEGPTDRLPAADDGAESFLWRACRVAREAAHAAGEPLRELHGRVEQVEYKSDKADIVTEADYQSQHVVATAIATEFPEHTIRSEEETDHGGDGAYTWLIDPLDGTGNFAHGNPNYAVSIALVGPEDRPLVGVVYNPETDETFHAVDGEGAYQNDVRIEPTDRDRLDESMLLSGYDPEGAFLQRFYHETQGVRRLGSAALHLAYVAAGSADAVWEYDTYPWDVAAGLVILREVGGRATDDAGRPYALAVEDDGGDDEPRRPLLASNGPLHPALLDHLDGG